MNEIIPEEFKELFANKGINFNSLWERRDAYVDEPNFGRGKAGWSAVSRIELDGKGFYLKKQENFLSYSLKHPFGITVAEKEFQNLNYCAEKNIPAMKVAYFGVRKVRRRIQAMVMTEELSDYYDLSKAEEFLKKNPPSFQQKRAILQQVAKLVRTAHQNHFLHNALYPKHIFIAKKFIENGNESIQPVCRYIDLEKGQIVKWGQKKQLRDLETLSRRFPHLSKTAQIYFLLNYLNEKKVTPQLRKVLKNIETISKS